VSIPTPGISSVVCLFYACSWFVSINTLADRIAFFLVWKHQSVLPLQNGCWHADMAGLTPC
jgi:hypothetical protein